MTQFNFSVIEGNLVTGPHRLINGEVHFILKSRDNFRIQCAAGRLADNIYKYLHLGSRVLISGILHNDGIVYLEPREVNFLNKASEGRPKAVEGGLA